MQIRWEWAGRSWQSDLNQTWDLSLPFRLDLGRAWHCGPARLEPVRAGDFIGSVALGGSVNFYNLTLNPHGQGTHTESRGHIRAEWDWVEPLLPLVPLPAYLLSVELGAGQTAIGLSDVLGRLPEDLPLQALILRTLPQTAAKADCNHTGRGGAYLEPALVDYLVAYGIKHLLCDLPSIDPEEDGGAVLAHHRFWADESRADCTLTELLYIPLALPDALYLLRLETAALPGDASPSRPLVSLMVSA